MESIKTFEKENVIYVYDKISKHFDHTRGYVWPGVKKYFKTLPDNCNIIDCWCGNGRNMIDRFNWSGIDLSIEQCKIAKKKTGFNIIKCSVTNIPFDDSSFDHAICCAVIHPLSDYNDRLKAIMEIIRVIKTDGTALITVWEHDVKDKHRHTKEGMIGWKLQAAHSDLKEDTIFNRYYYLFDIYELKDMIDKIDNVKIKSIHHECGNTYTVIQKL